MLYKARAVSFRAENKRTDRLTKPVYRVVAENGERFADTDSTLATIFANWLYWKGFAYKATVRYVSPLRGVR